MMRPLLSIVESVVVVVVVVVTVIIMCQRLMIASTLAERYRLRWSRLLFLLYVR